MTLEAETSRLAINDDDEQTQVAARRLAQEARQAAFPFGSKQVKDVTEDFVGASKGMLSSFVSAANVKTLYSDAWVWRRSLRPCGLIFTVIFDEPFHTWNVSSLEVACDQTLTLSSTSSRATGQG